MLSRYQDKTVRITDESGYVFTGTADVYPSGYGLSEFSREEESIRIGDTFIFKSDIMKIEITDSTGKESQDRIMDLIGELIDGPYRIVDIFPKQVPADSEGQYFAVDRYFTRPERIRALRRRFAEVLLRLNCYYDMTVSFDACMTWEENPDPEDFARRVEEIPYNGSMRAVFAGPGIMLDLDAGDAYMTAYGEEPEFLELLRMLASSAGLFLWREEEYSDR